MDGWVERGGVADVQNILQKIPVSSIFPNASSRRGRKANQPRKRAHPNLLEPQGPDYGANPASLQPRPRAVNMDAISPLLLLDGPTNKKTARRTNERQRKAGARAKARPRGKDVSEKILSLTVEIISVLAGEEVAVVTKSGEPVMLGPLVMEGPKSLGQERRSQQRILDLAFSIIQLLNGKGPAEEEEEELEAVAPPTVKGRRRSPYKSVIVASTSRGERRSKSAAQEEEGVSGGGDIFGTGEEPTPEMGMITETGAYAQTIVAPFKGPDTKEDSSGSDGPASSDHTGIHVKEESTSCEDTGEGAHFLSIKVKEESLSEDEGGSDEGEAYTGLRYNYHNEDSGESDHAPGVFAPPSFEQFPPTHTEPAPMLFPSGAGPMDFLGFDDGSNLDTDVSALIKHAHTKFAFAPIEGGSASEEDEETDVQPPKDDPAPKKPAPALEEPAAASGEEGPSEEVTSTKKDRGVKTYACSECSECFVRRSDFANHRRDHRRERLTCPECGKVFANKPGLLNHLTGHTGEKPYSCPVCGKCFTRNSNLIVHQATHLERSPFTALNVGDVLVKQIMRISAESGELQIRVTRRARRICGKAQAADTYDTETMPYLRQSTCDVQAADLCDPESVSYMQKSACDVQAADICDPESVSYLEKSACDVQAADICDPERMLYLW
ncbi:uncharacterized protein PAF06_020044 [Gastrophryne carolinensis]